MKMIGDSGHQGDPLLGCMPGRFINQTFNETKINYCGDKDEPTVNQRKVREKTISCESHLLTKLGESLSCLFQDLSILVLISRLPQIKSLS